MLVFVPGGKRIAAACRLMKSVALSMLFVVMVANSAFAQSIGGGYGGGNVGVPLGDGVNANMTASSPAIGLGLHLERKSEDMIGASLMGLQGEGEAEDFNRSLIRDKEASAIEVKKDGVTLVAPSAGKNRQSVDESKSYMDYISFINMFGGPRGSDKLAPTAWLNYTEMTYKPMLESGEMSQSEYDKIQAQFAHAQRYLQNNPSNADGDDLSLSVTELMAVTKEDLWVVK